MDKTVRDMELNRKANQIREIFHKLAGEPRSEKIADLIKRNGFSVKEYNAAFNDEIAWPVYMDVCWNRYGPVLMDRVFQIIGENLDNPRYMDMFLRFAEFATGKKKNFKMKKADDFSELIAEQFLNPKLMSAAERKKLDAAQPRVSKPTREPKESNPSTPRNGEELHQSSGSNGDQGGVSEGTV